MGLLSRQQFGVKAQLQSRFPNCFKKCDTLVDARDACNASRQQSVVSIDGNVLLMAVPSSITTFDSFVFFVNRSITTAMATADVTVVVFDDPEVLTDAKKQEQARRDQKRREGAVQCSQDVLATPMSDDYTLSDIQRSIDVNVFMRNRDTRLRFIDEVSRVVFERSCKLLLDWKSSGHGGGHLVFDGIDIRGASRPFGAKRNSSIVASSEAAEKVFTRNFNIGEGDLKLAHVGRAIRTASMCKEEEICSTKTLSIISTIDTDSFAIELLEEARRAESGDTVSSILCLRERASKRGRQDDHDAYYLCCDLKMLSENVHKHMNTLTQSVQIKRSAMTLLVAGWTMCGCDFVDTVKPLRSDIIFTVLPTLIREYGLSVLESMPAAWEGSRESLQSLHEPLRCLLAACSTHLANSPRSQKAQINNLRNVDEIVLKRVSWVCSYWNSVEVRGNLHEFGFFIPHSF